MTTSRTTPAVFLDRDGTLIEDRGHLRSQSEVAFFPNTVRALRLLQQSFRLFIVTNQPGIAEGVIGPIDVAGVHEFVLGHLARSGIRIERVYCCPHRRSDDCRCIKPKPHYLRRASRQYGIDLGRSFVVGDNPHDIELASNAGATGIYVLTGHGERHREGLPPDAVVTPDIWAAARRIVKMSGYPECLDGDNEVSRAAAMIRAGGVVAFPTETVYGLGANVLDAKAVARLYEIKRRPHFDPLIAHVSDCSQAQSLVASFPKAARKLARRFWPGPLTLVLPKRDHVPEIVTAGLPTMAVRMPDHPLALALIREAGVPLAAPSANPFGRVSPTTAEHVRQQLGVDVEWVLDGGPCRVGIESTIVSFVEGRPALLRPGGVPAEEIEAIVGPMLRPTSDPNYPTAPGQFPQHYAPRTPLVMSANGHPPAKGQQMGLLSFLGRSSTHGFAAVEVLTPRGDLREAAANLFAALHRLDALNLDVIVAEWVPEAGVGLAINDRLRRASRDLAGAAAPRGAT